MPNKVVGLFLLVISGTQLAGCAMSGPKLSPEELAEMATIECADFYTLRKVDSKYIGLFDRPVNVPAGSHTVELEANCGYNNCPTRTYRFYANPGYIYRILPSNSIVVLDRSDQYQRKVDEMNPIIRGGVIEYANRAGMMDHAREVVRQAQSDRAALLERRKLNLPFVRKVGARVCTPQGHHLLIAFVESFTDEKIQVRVVDAVLSDNHNIHLASFTPEVIWDSPLNWDLCE